MIHARYATTWKASGDGRNITGRVAPYDVDGYVSGPDGEPMRIRLAPGVFAHAMRAPNRVQLRFEHAPDGDIMGRLGRCTALVEEADGLDGTFRAYPGGPGDQALAMIADGALEGPVGEGALRLGRLCETYPDAVFCSLLGHRPSPKRTPWGLPARAALA